MSISTLKRRLQSYGLKRRNLQENFDEHRDEIIDIIKQEIDGPSCISGYRSLWHTLRIKYGICIPRQNVQHLLKELDPEGAEERKGRRLKRRKYKSPGPNECWHIDGYDKLKPYGFAIHGAVDGYSRRVMWLKVARTNNNPKVVAKYYYDCVDDLGGCPRIVRTDPGTENGIIASMQCYLRSKHDDDFAGMKAHRYGASTGNQRIECWWSHFRRNRSSWWINFFKDLVDTGIFLDGNTYHCECLWFCFNEVLQKELDFVLIHWNTHSIRKSRHDTIPGKPEELYFLPELHGGENQLQLIQESALNEVSGHCESNAEENECQSYFQYVVEQESIAKPTDWRSALFLYKHLIALNC